MSTHLNLWKFAVDRYERPGAKDAFLALQDNHGVDISVLLFLLWVPEYFTGEKQELERFCTAAINEVKDWQEGVIKPLRAARRAAKENTSIGSTDYYETTKKVELEAEKRQLLYLERLAEESLERLILGEMNSDETQDGFIWGYFKGLGLTKNNITQSHLEVILSVN